MIAVRWYLRYGHCCIEAKGVLAMTQRGKAGSSDALENHHKPGIWSPAAWFLGGQVDQLWCADRLMQQCRPDLGEDGRRGGRPDARDGHQEVALAGERDHHLLHLRVQPGNHLIEMVDVFEV